MKIHDVRQNSPEWLAARRGVVTASEIDALVSPTWKVRTGEGPETYLYRKLAEKLLGWSQDEITPGGGAGSWAMAQGQLVETIARPWFAFEYNCDVQTPGFITDDAGKIGCSPDGIIAGADCGLEIKAPQPPTHLKYLVANEVPKDYLPQIHFSMLVTGLPRWTFVSYSRHFPPLVIEVRRDPAIESSIKAALESFFAKFDPLYARFKGDNDRENEEKTRDYYEKEGIKL